MGQQPVKALPAGLRLHAGEIGVLGQADDQQAAGIKMLKKTAQGQAGPVHVQSGQRHILVIGTFI